MGSAVGDQEAQAGREGRGDQAASMVVLDSAVVEIRAIG